MNFGRSKYRQIGVDGSTSESIAGCFSRISALRRPTAQRSAAGTARATVVPALLVPRFRSAGARSWAAVLCRSGSTSHSRMVLDIRRDA